MKTKTKVVVVGGGVVGVSALYHLAKKGWSDVVLVERKELTSGSTWHAAGLLPLFNMSYSVGQLHKYAVNLSHTITELGSSDKWAQFEVIILDKDKIYHKFNWQVEKYTDEGVLKDCWLTTMVSSPIPLGSSI